MRPRHSLKAATTASAATAIGRPTSTPVATSAPAIPIAATPDRHEIDRPPVSSNLPNSWRIREYLRIPQKGYKFHGVRQSHYSLGEYMLKFVKRVAGGSSAWGTIAGGSSAW